MTTADDFKETYAAGYAAFDQGDFHTAVALASQCIATSPPDSYWHFGALGLRCWAANYLADNASVERDAQALLTTNAGVDKPWFDGLALLNLGLVYRRAGDVSKARACFARASRRYAAYAIDAKQPAAWQWVNRFFAVTTHWAASGECAALKTLAADIARQPTPSEEMTRLAHAVDMYLRHARGETVEAEAEAAACAGVSRAFLVFLLLKGEPPDFSRNPVRR